MKFLFLKSKSAILVVTIFIAGSNVCPIYAVPAYTATIESISTHFDEKIMQRFKLVFKHSFSEKSNEPLDITTQKMNESKIVTQELVHDLEEKKSELEASGQKNSSLYLFIVCLLKIADELEKHFNVLYTTLTSGLNKKLKAAAFANKLTEVTNKIMTDENFKKMDDMLKQLQLVANNQAVVNKIDECRDDIKKVLQQYRIRSQNGNAAALAMLRKRLPY